MAKREFNLPGIQDLSKEQEDARALPKQGQHLIIGGPGTGKSVLALLRSRTASAGQG
jgi:DNA helicase-2/ATP-dependent DNA helicase PcrA